MKCRFIRAFTVQNTGFSGRNRVWLKFTAGEDKPHAPTIVFSLSFPRKLVPAKAGSGNPLQSRKSLDSRFRGNDGLSPEPAPGFDRREQRNFPFMQQLGERHPSRCRNRLMPSSSASVRRRERGSAALPGAAIRSCRPPRHPCGAANEGTPPFPEPESAHAALLGVRAALRTRERRPPRSRNRLMSPSSAVRAANGTACRSRSPLPARHGSPAPRASSGTRRARVPRTAGAPGTCRGSQAASSRETPYRWKKAASISHRSRKRRSGSQR